MNYGIAIFGLNGGGKSTLSHMLYKILNFYEIDVEDYYFPEQKTSRLNALENKKIIPTEHLGELPFSLPRTKNEVEISILRDIYLHPNFILSSVTMNWNEEILSRINIAFHMQTPLKNRLERIQKREEKRFGARVIQGGDMYEQQINFLDVVAKRSEKSLMKSISGLSCPIINIDGTLPISEELRIVISNIF